jgi:hypothetical protein
MQPLIPKRAKAILAKRSFDDASATLSSRKQEMLRGGQPKMASTRPKRQPSWQSLGKLGARMTTANVAFDDHPNEKRFADCIETVMVDSVFEWLQRSGLGASLQAIRWR